MLPNFQNELDKPSSSSLGGTALDIPPLHSLSPQKANRRRKLVLWPAYNS
jgi:hypothetical protein